MRSEEAVVDVAEDLLEEPPMAGMINGSSFSGGERDVVYFQSADGETFTDISMVSGLANPGDGRVSVRADFDRDGFVDLALVGANAPLLSIYRNQLGDIGAASDNVVAVSLVGGATEASSAGLSPRNPYGARIEFRIGDRVIVRELRCGEGMSALNSSVLLQGLGDAVRVNGCTVYWPSGRSTSVDAIESGEWVTVHETRGVAARTEYRRRVESDGDLSRLALAEKHRRPPHPLFSEASGAEAEEPMHLFVFMGTWCASCHRALESQRRLAARFDGELGVHGITDHRGPHEEVDEFVATEKPPYDVRILNAAEVEMMQELCRAERVPYSVPLYVLTDARGAVLRVGRDLPSVSEVRSQLNAR